MEESLIVKPGGIGPETDPAGTTDSDLSMAFTRLIHGAENAIAYGEDDDETEASTGYARNLQQVSAESLPLEQACDYAGIPLRDGKPTLEFADKVNAQPTTLQPWQPLAIAWLMRQLDSPLHGGVLADSCGLGKTLTETQGVHSE